MHCGGDFFQKSEKKDRQTTRLTSIQRVTDYTEIPPRQRLRNLKKIEKTARRIRAVLRQLEKERAI